MFLALEEARISDSTSKSWDDEVLFFSASAREPVRAPTLPSVVVPMNLASNSTFVEEPNLMNTAVAANTQVAWQANANRRETEISTVL